MVKFEDTQFLLIGGLIIATSVEQVECKNKILHIILFTEQSS